MRLSPHTLSRIMYSKSTPKKAELDRENTLFILTLCAKRGVSGALYSQSALARLNSCTRILIPAGGLISSVDNQDRRNYILRTRSGLEGSSL